MKQIAPNIQAKKHNEWGRLTNRISGSKTTFLPKCKMEMAPAEFLIQIHVSKLLKYTLIINKDRQRRGQQMTGKWIGYSNNSELWPSKGLLGWNRLCFGILHQLSEGTYFNSVFAKFFLCVILISAWPSIIHSISSGSGKEGPMCE